MSRIGELWYDIEQLYIEGLNAGQIARELECPKSMVLDWLRENGLEVKSFDKWNKRAQRRLMDDLVAE
jgi:DNA-directed RNA polymerase specialized sigma24 family protein